MTGQVISAPTTATGTATQTMWTGHGPSTSSSEALSGAPLRWPQAVSASALTVIAGAAHRAQVVRAIAVMDRSASECCSGSEEETEESSGRSRHTPSTQTSTVSASIAGWAGQQCAILPVPLSCPSRSARSCYTV